MEWCKRRQSQLYWGFGMLLIGAAIMTARHSWFGVFDHSWLAVLYALFILLSLLDSEPQKLDRALADLGTARNLDPLNAWVAAMHAASLRFAGKFIDAIAVARHALALDSENFLAHWSVVISLAALARFDEAIIAADAALRMSGRHPWILAELAAIHAARGAEGDGESAEAVYQELRDRAQSSYIGFAEQSAAAASAGHLAEARALVQKAIDAREVYVLYWKLSAWAPLRADAEGNKILRSTGL